MQQPHKDNEKMKKKTLVGWMEDGTVLYDCDSGHAIKGHKKAQDETLRYFTLGPRILPDQIVMYIPLISAEKSFWGKRKSFKVKVTIEKCGEE